MTEFIKLNEKYVMTPAFTLIAGQGKKHFAFKIHTLAYRNQS